jgi:hypothetical protein
MVTTSGVGTVSNHLQWKRKEESKEEVAFARGSIISVRVMHLWSFTDHFLDDGEDLVIE